MWHEISGNFCYVFPILVAAIVVRAAYVLYWTGRSLRASASERVRTLIVLGSGGHTAEMLSILNVLQKDKFVPRYYVAAVTDNMSLQKARVLEESLVQQGKNSGRDILEAAQFMQIYRSREVGQSYFTSIGTTLIAIVHALWLTLQIRPQVIICNGPGTCIPLCVSAYLFKVLGLRWSTIFYVESIARVRKLSLSGLFLYKLHLVDQFVVQWPQLQKKYPRAHYVGRLM
ncbi:UDP-N-acetylglucosamine transferase subunit ALG14 homolog [Phoenix dactylifera]|uniref:UDP-N-acetylglucosamine transferase subunit ALG14 n=1 Tax=Phoenix dactylifera TaxID=42345 RepID=A0A8B8ZBI9_PHODC|nr:UDP-N-acetylglucosamine transferase subunit ALG14 homolog [Phoenix dactylifera]XP_008811386.2 UDP-N-acetylglucosamine transferase subunit ALG14 homolog [Phoenix dactylifera]XP_038971451.1 UDP-N-acetylglucosamine transferase subunit ALG14 homolog [Phoenix dactylifera]